MSAFKNDGTIPYGSKVLTVGSSSGGSEGTTYVAEGIQLTDPSGLILRKNEIGEPSGQVAFNNEVRSFTCTLQLATTSSVPPSKGWETTVTFDATTGAEVYFLHERGMAFEQEGETKVSATFRKKIN
ncbi:MAG: hypothetical protein QM813_26390 [Verrucomicrobiota bacterium]